ncbi:polysaccharide biosynthesis tyrosine autokinase [Rhizobium tumorigenes]|uniref:non-specific protein-tyrosine kinase n=1 Tax=Rhizobium tumorigenes TaxID=2041385 RepID=A0AAF1KSB2_9HYPH|nr:polysaccharide biosynthesis tyrosine autokinase [Rhizobium tumorigenes]WFR97737.1 polysaccharide biosynthesis tyrosine autokinase [Rhizobium tumorigenes]
MLSPDKLSSRSDSMWDASTSVESLDFNRLLAIVRRQWRIVAICALVFMVLGVVIALTATPKYTAETDVLIEHSNSGIVNQISDSGAPVSSDDESTVLSQLEIIKSKTIALDVIRKLDLTHNAVFMQSESSILGTARSMLNIKALLGGAPPKQENPETIARAVLFDNMAVERSGRSYVMNISYTSPDPDLAAQIADAFADVYVVDKLDSRYEATRRASEWLQERIDELKQKASDSDLEVQKYRSLHNLMPAKDGSLISDQQLSELNSALIVAQSDRAQAQAKYDRVKSIIDAKRTDAIVTDVLGSSVSNDLRQKYLAASKTEADISSRLGANHVQAVRLRSEMAEYQRQMFEELGRIAESYNSELQVAKAKEDALRTNVAQASGVSAVAGETQVKLRELERTADSYRNLLQTSLASFQEASQQQSFPITEARIITNATPPDKPSKPKKPLVVAIATFLGIALGGGIGAFREFRDRFFRTGEQVRNTLELEYLGSVLLDDKAKPLKDVSPVGILKTIRPINSLMRYVVDHPHSAFAETMRSAKISADLQGTEGRSKVIGIISTLPGEGKSTIAVNFAELLAMQGARTLLIDADLRNPGATRSLGQHAKDGLLEVLIGQVPMSEAILTDTTTSLTFLPAVSKRRVPHSPELLVSPAMTRLLDEAKEHFDYIVIDLPPIGPVVDARAMSPLLDAVLMVVEWGRTSRQVVRNKLMNEARLYDKCAGVILNKVDAKKMDLYREFGSEEYYHTRYADYYHQG